MGIENQLLFFFAALGVFNGLILSGYFLTYLKPRKLVNILLGLLFLMMCIRVGKSVFLYFIRDLSKIYLQIGLTACILIGPLLFLYLKAAKEKLERLSLGLCLHVAIPLLAVLIAGVIYPYEGYPEIWNGVYIKVIYPLWGIYTLAAGFLIKDLIKGVFVDFKSLESIERWQLLVYVSALLTCVIFISAYFGSYYILGSLSFSVSFYVLAFYMLSANNRKMIQEETRGIYKRKIETTAVEHLSHELKKLMDEKRLFENQKLKLADVAQELDCSPHQLSQLLNDNIGTSFSAYINELRVQAACDQIDLSDQITMEALGNHVGFTSRSAFYTAFKNVKGITPAKYRAQAAKKV